MSDFLAKVRAQLDMSQANNDMNAFLNKDRKVKVKVDLDTGNVNINSLLSQINNQFKSVGQTAGNNLANSINSSLGKINVQNAASQIANLQRTLKSMNFNSSSIDTITKNLQQMELEVTKVTTRMNGQNLNIRVDGIDQMGRAVSVVKEFDSATGHMQRTSETVSQSMKQMFSQADASKLSASIEALDANFVKLKGSINSESTELQKLKEDLAAISNIKGFENQQAEFERITQRVNNLSTAYKKAKAEATSAAAAQQVLSGKTILGNQITTWMNKNTKATKIYETELRNLQVQLQAVSNGSQLQSVANQFRVIQSTAAAAGNLGGSVFSQLIGNMTKLSPLFGMGTAITTSINTVKSMISSVYELDTALVDLQKTTTMNSTDLESFYSNANGIAKQMGVSTAEIINQASAWSRLGYSTKEAAESMAQLSSQFAAISPGMDVDTATDGLVSIMKAYDVDVDDVLDGIMSKINIIGNTAATSNADIVNMLTRSSSAMAEANNTLDETIALETAAVEITQDADSVGTAFKTISMRIRGYDEETETYSNDVEVLNGKIADLTKTASTPGGISLFTDETKTEYKSTYQLLEEISKIYDQLTDKDQAQLLEALAGKRQGQIVAATIKNFSAAQKAMDNMANSAGDADKEMGVIQQSLEYKVNAMKESGVGIAQNLFKKDDMKAVVDVVTSVLSIIDALTEKLGLFGTIGAGVGITALVKNFSTLKEVMSQTVTDSINTISNISKVITSEGLLDSTSVNEMVAALDGLSLKQAQVALSTTDLTAAQKAQVLNAAGLIASEDAISAALAEQALAQAGLSSETSALVMEKAGLTTATATCTAAQLEEALATQNIVGADAEAIMSSMGLSAANTTAAFSFEALTASVSAAATAIKSFLLTNPLGWAILAGTAILGVTTAFKNHSKAVEEARQSAQESAKSFSDSQSSIDDYISKIDELRTKLDSGNLSEAEAYETKKQLLDIQNELKTSYGDNAAGIDLLNGKIEEQIGLVKRLTATEASEYLNKNADSIKKAEKEMTKTLGGDGGWFTSAGEYLGTFYDRGDDESKKIKEIIDKYKENITMDDNGDGSFHIRFVGDATQAEDVLNSFMTDIRNAEDTFGETDMLSELFTNSGAILDEADDIIDKYKDIYEAAKQAKMIEESYGDSKVEYAFGDKSETALDWLEDYTNAVNNYNDALASGDPSKISSAKSEFEALDTAVQSLLKDDDFSGYADMFNEVRDQLDETTAKAEDFSNMVNGENLDEGTTSLREYSDQLKELNMTDIQFSDKVLSGLDDSAVCEAIQNIVNAYSDLYGLDPAALTPDQIEGIASSLVKSGVLIHDTTQDATNDVKEFSTSFQGFQDMLNDTEEGSFSDSLDTYTEKLDTLKDSLEKFNEGDLTESDITTLMRQFPQLINYADDMGTGIQSLIDEILNVGDSSSGASSLVDFFTDAIASLGGESTEAGAAMAKLRDQILDFYNAANNGGVKLNIDTETQKFSNLYGAIKNSRSATGLTNDDISNIKSMYSGLQSYDPSVLFERTENGIHLNTKALRELEAEYETLNKNEISSKLRELRTQMDNLSDADTKQKEKIQAQIDSLEILESQYIGLTSTYNKWIQAQSSGTEHDMYDTIGSGRETVQGLIDRGWVGSDEVRQYIDLISGKDLSTANIEELMTAWQEVNSTIEGTNFTAFDFFTTDSDGNSTADGVYNFFDAVNQKLGDGYAKIEKTVDENGEQLEKYTFDFSNGKGKEVADALGLDYEYIQSILRAAIDAGFDVDLNSAWEQDLDSAVKTVEDKRAELEAAGTEPIEINLDVKAGADGDTSEIQSEIDKVTAEIERINDTPVELRTEADTENLEYYTEALGVLIQKKIDAEQPAYMSIDASSATASMSECLQTIQNYKQAENELNALKLNPTADTSQIEAAEQKVRDAAQEIQNLPQEAKTKIGIEGEDSVDTIIEKMKSLDPDTEVFLTVDTKDSTSNVSELKENIEGLQGDHPVEITITIGGDGLEGVNNLKTALSELEESKPVDVSATVKGTPETKALHDAIESLHTRTVIERANVYGTKETTALHDAIVSLYSRVVTERANVYGTSDVQALKRAIDSLYDKQVTTTHITNNVTNNTTNNTTNNRTYKVANGTANPVGSSAYVDGSAYANGTTHKEGNWGLKNSGIAFGGEVGQELLVRDGRFFTIGDESAEFFKYKKGDIIFNAEQTKQIFEKGKIQYGKKRGKAFATGTAFVDASSGSGVRYVNRSHWTPSTTSNYTPSSSYTRTRDTSGSVPRNSGNSSNQKTAADVFKDWLDKLFDWVEIKLERQTRKIEKYTTRADAALEGRNYRSAAGNYANAISSSATQITYNEQGAKKYKSTADQVLSNAIGKGLISNKSAKNIAKAVANGTINISTYSKNVQEVIKGYKEWYDKSLDCADAVETLHQNIRKYVESLKDVRDAQRDLTLQQADTLATIGTSGVTSTSGAYYGLANSQLDYKNSTLKMQNNAYNEETTNVMTDATTLGKTANSSVNSQLKSVNKTISSKTKNYKNKRAAYKKALKNAQAAIKAKKAVSASDLKEIKKYSTSTYERLYAYNLQLENVETARMEQATAYAANSAEIYKNTADKYANKDTATNNKLDLYKQKAQNATSAKSANAYLKSAAAQYDTILADDKAEIATYSKNIDTSKATIKKSNSSQRGKNYSSLAKASKANVDKYIDAAQKCAKEGKAISASVLGTLAKYYSKGYITLAFYQACIDYNNALESKRQAEAQYAIDQETAKAEKASIGSQMVDNVVQEYTNKSNANASKTAAIQTKQSLKTTRGLSLTKSDYEDLIGQSKKDQQIYNDEASAIDAQIKQNLANGYWTTSSQEYKDAVNTLDDYKNKAAQCAVEQEEWNNSIAQLPYKKLEDALEVLDTIKDNIKSLISIDVAKGISETADQYRQEIDSVNKEIDKNKELRNQAWNDYLKATNSSDGVYGGKTADEWLKEYYKYDTTINGLTKDVVELNNAIAQLPYDTIEKALDSIKALASYNKSAIDLKSDQGIDLSEEDYMSQIQSNNDQIDKLESERSQAYQDYLKALADADGVYGGKTKEEWLKTYDEFGTEINNLKSDNEKLKDSLRDDVFWRTYERAHKACERYADVLSGIKDLIDEDMYFDSDGKITEYGISQLANLVGEYENARKEVQNYSDDITNLNDLYAKGYYTQEEYNEKLGELQKSLMDSASDMKSAMNEIMDMYKDMAQSELDNLFKIIDARNEALSAKKEYYDYDKTISSKTKDIQALQAQIAALEGVETAEAKAKRATLEAQLSEAQDDLNDTINDHMFDLSQDSLNDMKDVLQDAFDDKWDNISSNLEEIASLMAAANTLTASSTATINDTLNELLRFYGIDPVSTGIKKTTGYASGTKRAKKDETAWVNEYGTELMVSPTDNAILAGIKKDTGIIPAGLTDNLFDWGEIDPAHFISSMTRKLNDRSSTGQTGTSINQHYDSLLNVEGNVDSTVVSDMEKLTQSFYKGAYEYTVKEIARDARKVGIKV